jgi:hypothetical protein
MDLSEPVYRAALSVYSQYIDPSLPRPAMNARDVASAIALTAARRLFFVVLPSVMQALRLNSNNNNNNGGDPTAEEMSMVLPDATALDAAAGVIQNATIQNTGAFKRAQEALAWSYIVYMLTERAVPATTFAPVPEDIPADKEAIVWPRKALQLARALDHRSYALLVAEAFGQNDKRVLSNLEDAAVSLGEHVRLVVMPLLFPSTEAPVSPKAFSQMILAGYESAKAGNGERENADTDEVVAEVDGALAAIQFLSIGGAPTNDDTKRASQHQ